MATLTKRFVVLAALLLASCTFYDTRHTPKNCLWGGETDEESIACAEHNFGTKGAAYILERDVLCRVCAAHDPDNHDQQYCTLNCPEAINDN